MTRERKVIKVAILAEEPIGWGSGKHYFPVILDGYAWCSKNASYKFSTTYIFDKDILQGRLNVSDYDVLLIPGGGVGDGESIMKGFNSLPKVRKWKKRISNFVKDGGGIVGICGGASLITGLSTRRRKTPKTFMERQYSKCSLGISCVNSYYKDLGLPLFYPFQHKHPEKIGANAYIFSFSPGETVDGVRIHSAGVPIDFKICKNHPIFSDFPKETERIRWWGGPALLVPDETDRDITVLAQYPSKDLSENNSTNIKAWKYIGGIRGLPLAILKALKLVKAEKGSLISALWYTYYLVGDWKPTEKVIELNYSNKACITAEIYPNHNEGRILLCTAHPEYMVWWDGHIEEVETNGFNCIATGLHQWKDIAPLSKNAGDELTHTWWIVRRFVAWAAKIPDDHLPPIHKGQVTKKGKLIVAENIFWDGSVINQMKNI